MFLNRVEPMLKDLVAAVRQDLECVGTETVSTEHLEKLQAELLSIREDYKLDCERVVKEKEGEQGVLREGMERLTKLQKLMHEHEAPSQEHHIQLDRIRHEFEKESHQYGIDVRPIDQPVLQEVSDLLG